MSKIVRKDTDSDGVEVNIMYAFGLLLRRLWLLILVALVVGASCAVITKAVEEPTYTLSMTFIVNNKSEKDLSSSGENSVSYNDMSASAYMANTFVHLMTGRTMCNAIAAECKSYPKTADQVAKMIAVSRKTDSSIMSSRRLSRIHIKMSFGFIRAAASISATSRSCRQSRTSPSVQCATPSSALLRVQLYVRSL